MVSLYIPLGPRLSLALWQSGFVWNDHHIIPAYSSFFGSRIVGSVDWPLQCNRPKRIGCERKNSTWKCVIDSRGMSLLAFCINFFSKRSRVISIISSFSKPDILRKTEKHKQNFDHTPFYLVFILLRLSSCPLEHTLRAFPSMCPRPPDPWSQWLL